MKRLLAILIAANLYGCFGSGSSSDYPSVDTVLQNSVGASPSTLAPIVSSDSNANKVDPNSISLGQPNTAGVQTQVINAQPTTATASGMNPPHGQPGHRCEIAVGAPLNSAPAKTTTPTITSTSTPVTTPAPTITSTSTTPAAPKVKTAPGMNPPHGEPGHRCDLAVGAPLNSAPAKTATTTEPTKPAVLNSTLGSTETQLKPVQDSTKN
jgi:hypothetical protein